MELQSDGKKVAHVGLNSKGVKITNSIPDET